MAGVLTLVLAACTASGLRPERTIHCLEISSFPHRVLLGRYALPENGEFSLSFIHSVSRTPVRDDYRVDGFRIIQTAETFETHGAGLPSIVDETGVTGWEYRDGRFVVGMHRPIPRLIVRTDRNYRNHLSIGGVDVNLNAWEDQALEVAVAPCAAP